MISHKGHETIEPGFGEKETKGKRANSIKKRELTGYQIKRIF